MSALPPAVTRAVLEHELSGAEAWAGRHGWSLRYDEGKLLLEARFPHPVDGGELCLRTDFNGYKVVPPAWWFVDAATGESHKAAWPAGGRLPGISGTIFHPQPVICAPFNRLAYTEHQGPHGDWNGPVAWLSVNGAPVRATTIGAMMSVIDSHLSVSPGRMT